MNNPNSGGSMGKSDGTIARDNILNSGTAAFTAASSADVAG